MAGARAVRTSVLEGFPNADLSVSIVWLDMLKTDSRATAEASARMLEDPRVRHFHDAGQGSGRAVSDTFDWQNKVAWDIYMFFEKGTQWTGSAPPPPIEWMYQLRWADPAHFHTGDDLVNELRDAMGRLTDAGRR